MKITMITHDRKIDRRIIQEAKTLSDNGFEVSIVAFPWEGLDSYEGIKVLRYNSNLKSNGFDILRKVYSHLKKFLFSHPKLMFFSRNIVNGCFIDVERYFESHLLELAVMEKADIYHAHDLPSLTSAVKAAKINNSLVVYDSHEIYCEQGFGYMEKRKWHKLEMEYIKSADAIITVNDSAADYLSSTYGVSAVVVMNKLDGYSDINKVSSKIIHDILGLEYKTRIILYQGGIVGGRNIENLVYSMKYVKSNAVLVLLGSGDYRGNLISLVRRLNLNDKVYFIDEVGQDKLLAYTQSADIGVIPYAGDCLNNYYCTPNKLFEFISAELPIIANKLPELERIVEGEGFGITVDFTKPDIVAEKLDEIFARSELLEKYRANMKNNKYKYSWDYEEKKLLGLYNTLLEK